MNPPLDPPEFPLAYCDDCDDLVAERNGIYVECTRCFAEWTLDDDPPDWVLG